MAPIKNPFAFVSTLSKKEKFIFAVTAAFIIIAFLDRVVFQVIFSKMEVLDEQIKAQQLLIKKDLRVLAQKNAIISEDTRYSVYSVKPKSEEEEISGILKEIESLATQAAVYMGEIKPAGVKDEKIAKKYSITLTCEATMEQLAQFMNLIENSKVLFIIDSYSLAIKDREKGTLKCALAISKVVVP
jgi:hypothetical protein